MELTPIFRIEKFLDAIVNSTTPPEPVFRVEYFLAKIAGADVVTPEPMFRIEKYLAKICGEDVEIPEPAHRIEYWLAKKCGEDVETPEPVFRVEYWLDEWAGGSAPTYETVTGRIVSFLTQRIAPLKIEADLEPIQSGTGDPSPDNVRPISGHTGADIYVRSAYDAQATPTVQITFGQTVYGGKLTVNEDGTKTVTSKKTTSDLSAFSYNPETVGSYIRAKFGHGNTSIVGTPVAELISNALTILPDYPTFADRPLYSLAIKADNYYPLEIKLPAEYDTSAKIKALFADLDGNGTHCVVLRNKTEESETLANTDVINALQGNNTVWVDDSDNISVTYQSN